MAIFSKAKYIFGMWENEMSNIDFIITVFIGLKFSFSIKQHKFRNEQIQASD